MKKIFLLFSSFLLFFLVFLGFLGKANKIEIEEEKIIQKENIEERQDLKKTQEEIEEERKKEAEELKKKISEKIERFKNEHCLILKDETGNYLKIEEVDKIKNLNFECVFGKQKHLNTPEKIKGIYLGSHSLNSSQKIENILKVLKNSSVNSVVIDIKEVDGKISFNFPVFGGEGYESNHLIEKPLDLIQKFHDQNIYVIGRIVVFKDNYLTKKKPELAIHNLKGGIGKDRKGNQYLNPQKEEVGEKVVDLAKKSYQLGFDEINFDYIRFPSDGNIKEMAFKNNEKGGRVKIMDRFYNYLHQELKSKEKIPISADVFGYTTLVTNDDLGIGQIFEDALLYFDRVSPMIYPSHYGKQYGMMKNPNDFPYLVLWQNAEKMEEKIKRLNWKIKNSKNGKVEIVKGFWVDLPKKEEVRKSQVVAGIQAFNCYGCSGNKKRYGKEEIGKEIRALKEKGFFSWLAGNPKVFYKAEWFKE